MGVLPEVFCDVSKWIAGAGSCKFTEKLRTERGVCNFD